MLSFNWVLLTDNCGGKKVGIYSLNFIPYRRKSMKKCLIVCLGVIAWVVLAVFAVVINSSKKDSYSVYGSESDW